MSSDAFVRGVMGPIGSGKSVCCCMEVMRRIREAYPGIDGKRKTRVIVVRNTLPQLETTTLKTWLDWFPEHIYGKVSRKPPYTQQISLNNEIEAEVIFLALDKPEDVKKVLSLECTFAWINEAREVPKEILDALTGRVGRYPSQKDRPAQIPPDKWPTWTGIIMDTNPPNDDHWWYKLAEEEKPEGFEFFQQPSARSKDAENKEFLRPGYYENLIAGKSKEFIQVYVDGQYGVISEGQPVYGDNYSDELHTAKTPIPVNPNLPLYIGLDFGLTPCAVFAQKSLWTEWFILNELVTEDTSLVDFVQILAQMIQTEYPNLALRIWGDPSGGFQNPHDGRTAFDIFRRPPYRFNVLPAPGGNKFQPRKEAVLRTLTTMVNGHTRFLMDKKCKMLRRGFNGGYRYKRIQVSGEARYAMEPEKNKYSHPHDALQYVMCGGGEYRELFTDKESSTGRTVKMKGFRAFR